MGIETEVAEGHYGEFTVLVDGKAVAKAGRLGFLGVLPSTREVLARVQEKLSG